ncbi:hypothetical protein HanIR_Chr16g0802941 [Helianthus annuus]|nr:hypothetical protein HanIR_Chr16g0802941 [Helianthus annuus]
MKTEDDLPRTRRTRTPSAVTTVVHGGAAAAGSRVSPLMLSAFTFSRRRRSSLTCLHQKTGGQKQRPPDNRTDRTKSPTAATTAVSCRRPPVTPDAAVTRTRDAESET